MYNYIIFKHTINGGENMKKISSWNEEYIKSLVPYAKQYIFLKLEDLDTFDDTGNPVMNTDELYESATAAVLTMDELDGIIASDDHDDFYELLWAEFDKQYPNYVEESLKELKDQKIEYKEYRRDPLGYHGMSRSDFI